MRKSALISPRRISGLWLQICPSVGSSASFARGFICHLSSVICHALRSAIGYRLFAKRWLFREALAICEALLFRPEGDAVGLIPERNPFSHRAGSDIDHPRGGST